MYSSHLELYFKCSYVIFVDELGNRETFTYAEVFEKVKLYAAAFRKLGLTIGDRVSCKYFGDSVY